MLSSATKAAANVTKNLAENDIRHTIDDVVGNGRDTVRHASDYALEAGQKVRGFVDRTVDQGRDVSDKVTTEIKANPIRSSAIALGAGFLLGALLARR